MSDRAAPQSPQTASDNPTPSQTIGKRKRSQVPENIDSVDGANKSIKADDRGKQRFQDLLLDIHEILKSYDTIPSILEVPIKAINNHAPAAKRAKLEIPTATVTITAQIQSHAYQKIEELIADVETATASLSEAAEKTSSSNGSHATACPSCAQAYPKQIAIFKRRLGDIVRSEMLQRPEVFGLQKTIDDKAETGKKIHNPSSVEQVGKTVLTLFGGEAHPRQLFSSLPLEPTPSSTDSQSFGVVDDERLAILASREAALPNGISTTKIIAMHPTDPAAGKEQPHTLGQVYAISPGLAVLDPPKQSKHTATRSQSVNWYNPAESPAPTKPRLRESFATQALSSGQWLSYNIAHSSIFQSQTREKQKQRDRALSIGEPKPALSLESAVAQNRAKEGALFNSLYSSFAPDHDNSAALIPQQVKNNIWWTRVGETKYQNYMDFVSETMFDDDFEDAVMDNKVADEEEDRLFKDAVESWTPEEMPDELRAKKDGTEDIKEEDKDVEEILTEISELLESLNSYQQIRNMSLATTAGQNAQLAAMAGTPTTPSAAEIDVYSMLKSQLHIMISALPPYAVAKLHGRQFGELNVSIKITTKGSSLKGTMEENDPARFRMPVLPVVTPTAGRVVTPYVAGSSKNGYLQAPGVTTPQRGSYTSSRKPGSTGTFPIHLFDGRSSSLAQIAGLSASGNRLSYSQQQNTPSHNGQYSNGTRQHPTQNGHSGYTQQHGGAPTTPTVVPGTHLQRPSQPGYQQRAQTSQTYSNYGSAAPTGRSRSPTTHPATQSPHHPTRASYATPTHPTSYQRPPSYRPLSQHGLPSDTTPHYGGAVGTVGAAMGISAEEQAMLIHRQKSRLAAQESQDLTRSGPGITPANVNGGFAPQSNGTGPTQANGVTAGQGH